MQLAQAQVFQRRDGGIVVIDIQFPHFQGRGVVRLRVVPAEAVNDITTGFQLAEFGIDTGNDVANEGRGNGFIHRPRVRLRHRVGQYLRGAGVVLKQEKRIIRAGTVSPKLETIIADKRGDTGLIQQVGVGRRFPANPTILRH